jgi:hypothetical protein
MLATSHCAVTDDATHRRGLLLSCRAIGGGTIAANAFVARQTLNSIFIPSQSAVCTKPATERTLLGTRLATIPARVRQRTLPDLGISMVQGMACRLASTHGRLLAQRRGQHTGRARTLHIVSQARKGLSELLSLSSK